MNASVAPVIASFVPADQPGVVAMILPIQQQEFGIAITAADQPDLADIPGFYQTGKGGFWVAKVDGVVVGSIGLKDIGNGQAALRKMFVAAPYRGRAPGVAQTLLHTLLRDARAVGLREVYLGTTAAFLAAHRFYEKHGFTEIPKATLPSAFPVMAVDSKFYRIALAPVA